MSGDGNNQNDGDFFPPPSKPRPVQGGIRAQSPKGRFGQTWWSRRWLATLEALGIGGRLERGRTYARKGQVISLDVELGQITASVQGTRSRPYDARIEMATLTQRDWVLVTKALAEQAIFRAKLLADKMPEGVEAVFARCGVSLFPQVEADLRVSCSCPDWADPCKHVAAVCYLVGEAFERDPFLIFRLRGIEREVLLAMVGGQAARGSGDVEWVSEVDGSPAAGDVSAAPLPDDAAMFWAPASDVGDSAAVATDATATATAGAGAGAAGSAIGLPLDLQPPPADAPLVRILGPLPLWRGTEDFEASMRRMYRVAAGERTLDVALGVVPVRATDA